MTSSDYRARARAVLAGNWKISVIAALIASLLGGLLFGSSSSVEVDAEVLAQMPPAVQSFLLFLVSVLSLLAIIHFVVGGVVRQGYSIFLLKQHDRQNPEIQDLFSQFSDFKRGFLLSLLQGLFVFLWSLLLVIPGLIATYKYAMAPFIMAENPDMRPREALRASTELMDGHKWELFCLGFSFIGWNFLAVLTLGIGTLWLNPYVHAAYAAFYREISSHPAELPEA